jgi:hypothetical protein
MTIYTPIDKTPIVPFDALVELFLSEANGIIKFNVLCSKFNVID